jgi:hypothetical protein
LLIRLVELLTQIRIRVRFRADTIIEQLSKDRGERKWVRARTRVYNIFEYKDRHRVRDRVKVSPSIITAVGKPREIKIERQRDVMLILMILLIILLM